LKTEVLFLGRSEIAWEETCPIFPFGNQLVFEVKGGYLIVKEFVLYEG